MCSPGADGLGLTAHLPPSAILPPEASREVSAGSAPGQAGAGAAEELPGGPPGGPDMLPV